MRPTTSQSAWTASNLSTTTREWWCAPQPIGETTPIDRAMASNMSFGSAGSLASLLPCGGDDGGHHGGDDDDDDDVVPLVADSPVSCCIGVASVEGLSARGAVAYGDGMQRVSSSDLHAISGATSTPTLSCV
jgi:hypothetical protein